MPRLFVDAVPEIPLTPIYRKNRAKGISARFSEVFAIQRDDTDDWYDPICSRDTQLFVSPQLVFRDHDPFWADARGDIQRFFTRAVLTPTSSRKWLVHEAARMLQFPEPREFALGLTGAGTAGSGIGTITASSIAMAIHDAAGLVEDKRFYLESLTILADGVGPDRLSDLVLNILKQRFIEYTKRIATKHHVRTQLSEVPNATFGKAGWRSEPHRLPHNPFHKVPILLVPSRFLQESYALDSASFYNWAAAKLTGDDRQFLNDLIGSAIRERVSTSRLHEAGRELARARPALVSEFLETSPAASRPYDIGRDPALRVAWLEIGRRFALKHSGRLKDRMANTSDPGVAIQATLECLADALSAGLADDAFWSDAARKRDQWAPVVSVFVATVLEQLGIGVNSNPMQLGDGLAEITMPNGRVYAIWLELQDEAARRRPTAPPRHRTVAAAAVVWIRFVRNESGVRFGSRADNLADQLRRPVSRVVLEVARGSNSGRLHSFR
ncbi:hypothetical protein [Nakamurella lactea]|uniref:hypothetical protein n=1 Tax=Nakamurella lactea TaxID=459515 RepID=UPI00048BEC88|nr:hypothetical protein [Nakamurella lactea]